MNRPGGVAAAKLDISMNRPNARGAGRAKCTRERHPDAFAHRSKTASAAIRRRRIRRQIKLYGLRTGSLAAIKREGDDRQHDHNAAENEAEKTHSTAVVRHDATPVPSGANVRRA